MFSPSIAFENKAVVPVKKRNRKKRERDEVDEADLVDGVAGDATQSAQDVEVAAKEEETEEATEKATEATVDFTDVDGLGGVGGLMASGKPPVRADVPDEPQAEAQTSVVSKVASIAPDEVYGKDEVALNSFLKLHPMLSGPVYSTLEPKHTLDHSKITGMHTRMHVLDFFIRWNSLAPYGWKVVTADDFTILLGNEECCLVVVDDKLWKHVRFAPTLLHIFHVGVVVVDPWNTMANRPHSPMV